VTFDFIPFDVVSAASEAVFAQGSRFFMQHWGRVRVVSIYWIISLHILPYMPKGFLCDIGAIRGHTVIPADAGIQRLF